MSSMKNMMEVCLLSVSEEKYYDVILYSVSTCVVGKKSYFQTWDYLVYNNFVSVPALPSTARSK
jgi:hypothetical protein